MLKGNSLAVYDHVTKSTKIHTAYDLALVFNLTVSRVSGILSYLAQSGMLTRVNKVTVNIPAQFKTESKGGMVTRTVYGYVGKAKSPEAVAVELYQKSTKALTDHVPLAYTTGTPVEVISPPQDDAGESKPVPYIGDLVAAPQAVMFDADDLIGHYTVSQLHLLRDAINKVLK